MALTAMSVDGQPSVLYLRRIQSPSRYHSSRPCSLSFASISSGSYVVGLALASMGIPPSGHPSLHHDAAVDVDGLSGDECGLGRGEVERRGRHILGTAPAF